MYSVGDSHQERFKTCPLSTPTAGLFHSCLVSPQPLPSPLTYQYNTVQYNTIQHNTTLLPSVNTIALGKFLWCQVPASHIHTDHKTSLDHNNSKQTTHDHTTVTIAVILIQQQQHQQHATTTIYVFYNCMRSSPISSKSLLMSTQ